MKASMPLYSYKLIMWERIIASVFAIAVISAFPIKTVITIFVALGQAHFILTYISKWRKSPFTAQQVLGYFGILLICFYLLHLLPWGFQVFAGAAFLYHSFRDDLYLAHHNTPRIDVIVLTPIIVLMLLEMLDTRFFIPGGQYFHSLVMLVSCMISAGIVYRKKSTFYRQWALALALAVGGLQLADLSLTVWHFFAFIVLCHYTNWYIKLGVRKYQKKKEEFYMFARECLAVNAVVGGCFIFYTYSSEPVRFLDNYVFSFQAFFVWSVMHILVSLRRDARV